MKPRKSETQQEFVSRCMEAESESIKDPKQRAAACYSMWRRAKGEKDEPPKGSADAPRPREDEARADYMARCREMMDGDDDACAAMWAEMHGGAEMPRGQMHVPSVFTVAQEIELRRNDLGGREHLVLPLIALVESVYQCANCPQPNFYPAAEFAKQPGAWNGRPVTIGHPVRDNEFVSAGSPDVWAKERVGTIFNARRDGDKLRLEAWIDPELVERAGGADVLAAVEVGDQVEVSTAAWIDEVPRFGEHNGKKYAAAQINFQPDHVALLKIGDVGACSWSDGCGVRVASARIEGGAADVQGDDGGTGDDPTRNVSRATLTTCCDACAHGDPCECGDAAVLKSAAELLRSSGYQVTEPPDEPQSEDGDMADDSKTQAAADTKPPADDKTKPEAQPAAAAQHLSPEQRQIEELKATVEHLQGKLAAQAQPKSLDQYLEAIPEEARESILDGIRAQKKRQLELIDAVKASPGCMYSDDELNAMKAPQLEKLVALAQRTDYSVQPAPTSRMRATDEAASYAPLPPGLWDKPKAS